MAISLKDIKKHHATGRSLSHRRFLLINVTKAKEKEEKRNIRKSSDDRLNNRHCRFFFSPL
jgi:hypothetical protein